MKKTIEIRENGLQMVFFVDDEKRLRLVNLSTDHTAVDTAEFDPALYKPVEISVTGVGTVGHHGMKHNVTGMGDMLRYVSHEDFRNAFGRKLEFTQKARGLKVISHYQFYDHVAVIRAWTELINESEDDIGLESVSSFCLSDPAKIGSDSWDKKCLVSIAHNYWCGEAQWYTYPISRLGFSKVGNGDNGADNNVKPISCFSTGNWSTSRYLPMGALKNTVTNETILWQIENNGSWSWEIGDDKDYLCLLLFGPCEDLSHWWKNLKPGEKFSSVPAAIAFSMEGFDGAVGAMTRYRRCIRRKNTDNIELPVIFNDYMNCLMGDPTSDKLFPLIDAAAEAGCEYFCIDAGWYADGLWWDGVGEWLPSEKRFPRGISEPLSYIRKKGMIPGLWLEIEVVGIHSPLAEELPDSWFFMRHGKRVMDHGRYQLDFRNPEVCTHADRIVARLVEEYGVGYIKMDYNIDPGIGTDFHADSSGDGMLEHNRAYLRWLDNVFARYPQLVIENCGSGGMRMDYAMLSRHSIQSCTDQRNYLKNAVIASACASAVTPEQGGIWSYPLRDADREQVAFNMINAMLMRIHQSGHLAEISDEGFELVREGIQIYKNILRKDIPYCVPFWPIGMAHHGDDWAAFGLQNGQHMYLAVWKLGNRCDVRLPLPLSADRVCLLYPADLPERHSLSADGKFLSVEIDSKHAARLYHAYKSYL